MKYQFAISMGLMGLTAMAGIGLVSNVVYADDSIVDDILLSIPVSCTMTGTGQDSHNADISNGVYRDNIGTTTLKTICNDNAGFAIYAIGFTGDEYSGENHTKLIGANTSLKISTGTATSGTTSNWAMKLATESTADYAITLDNGYGDYSVVPDTYTKVAHRNSGTDMGETATGAVLTTTYATFISGEQTADTYSGKVKYTLVHPASEVPLQPQTPTAGCINYFANASDAVGTMGCQSASDNASITLLASNFSRTGYGFAGWSDAFDYKTNENAHFYGPQETITAPAGTTANGLALYAVWVKSVGNLQDTNKVAELCGTGTNALTTAPTNGTANLSSVSALTDQRDNNTYAIAKLADGNCWMIENLRLENTGTDNTNGSLAQGYGGQFAGLAEPEAAWANNITTANSLYSTDGADSTINIGTSNASYRFPRYNHDNTNSRASSPTTNSTAMYSYGNYYTWAAAIADTTAYTTNNQSVENYSICPTGWHLPTGGSAYVSGSTSGVNVTGDTNTFREFYNLGYKIMDEVKTAYEDTPNSGYAYYSSNTTNTAGKTATAAFRSYPNNFVYSGYVSIGSVYNRGSYGTYWSSTAFSSYNAYGLYLHSSNVYPGTGDSSKYGGWTVRCVVSGV